MPLAFGTGKITPVASTGLNENDTYRIEKSLRFNSGDSSYLNRTQTATTTSGTFTLSLWLKRSSLSSDGVILYAGASRGTGQPGSNFGLDATGKFFIDNSNGSGNYNIWTSTAILRDPSSWMHVVFNQTGSTINVYVNGNLYWNTTTTSSNYFNLEGFLHAIGGGGINVSFQGFLNGYLTEMHFIDGQVLTPSSFGETDTITGRWKAKAYSGTYGTNGFYLPMSINNTTAYSVYQSDASTNYNILPHGNQGSTFQFTGDFTIEGWVYYPSSSSGDTSFYVQGNGSNYFAFNISMSAGNYNIYLNSSAPTSSISHGIKANDWTHVAMVRSGSTITLYTNGISRGTITNSSTLGYSSIDTNIHRFGGGVSGVARYMSNVRITKSAVYTSNFSVPTSPLTNISNTLVLTYQNSSAIDNSLNTFSIGTIGSVSFSLQKPFNTGVSVGKDNSIYRMLTAQTNGTSNGIQRGADLTGIVNGKAGTISLWVNFTNSASAYNPIWISRDNAVIGDTVQLSRLANGGIRIVGKKVVGSDVLNAETNNNICSAAGLYHIYVTWDLAVSNRVQIYVNGQNQNLTISTFVNDTITYSVPNHGLGGNLFNPFSPTTAAMFGQVYVNYSTYLDPVTNISKFYGGLSTPVSLGANGQIPTGFSPIVYLDGGASSILINRGTGGNFVAYGTLSTGTAYQGTGLYFNNLIPNNLSFLEGVNNDSLVDTPTNYGSDTGLGGEVRGNYATWNSLTASVNGTISNGNLEFAKNSSGFIHPRSSIYVSSGKWYAEFTLSSTSDNIGSVVGIMQEQSTGYVGFSPTSYAYRGNGNKFNNDTSTLYGSSFTANDIIGIALDLDAGTIVFYKNGVSQGTAFSSISGSFAFSAGWYGTLGTSTWIANFGQRPFTYAAPSGYRCLCTTNLPTPSIKKPNIAMDVVTYTGNGSTQTISGLGFEPDFIWLKSRDVARSHRLQDVVRGITKVLASDTTGSEYTSGAPISSVTSSGFTLSSSDDNVNNERYVTWSWDAGSTNSTNTSGSITSTVRANPQAGFSIVSYTGAGATRTVGHGLGNAPKMIIVKSRNDTQNWWVYHSNQNASPASGATLLNSTSAFATDSNYWNNTMPTSSVFSIGTYHSNSQNYIAYCFAEIEGYSKFGSYTGNGSADGPFVWCGFRPRFILLKASSAAYNWHIFDTARNTFNVIDVGLSPNLSNAEYSGNTILDINCNGFKLRTSSAGWNDANTHIFAAFAEAPFKYARAR